MLTIGNFAEAQPNGEQSYFIFCVFSFFSHSFYHFDFFYFSFFTPDFKPYSSFFSLLFCIFSFFVYHCLDCYEGTVYFSRFKNLHSSKLYFSLDCSICQLWPNKFHSAKLLFSAQKFFSRTLNHRDPYALNFRWRCVPRTALLARLFTQCPPCPALHTL